MVKLDKIYTRGGDGGETSLGGGARVGKHDPRVNAYGTADEANAVLGLARTTGLIAACSASLAEGQRSRVAVDSSTTLLARSRRR